MKILWLFDAGCGISLSPLQNEPPSFSPLEEVLNQGRNEIDHGDECTLVLIAGTKRSPRLICGPFVHLQRANKGSHDFRAGCFHACVGSLTARGLCKTRHIALPSVAFRISIQRRHPGGVFRGSIPSLRFPLSTLPHALAGRRGMTQGRYGRLTFNV